MVKHKSADMYVGRPNSRPTITKDPTTIYQLKQAIVTECGKLSQCFIDRAIGQWCRRLECVVQQQGGHIEHLM